MLAEKAKARAYEYHKTGGFHCAEAVAKAIVEFHAEEPNDDVPRAAAGFMGGIGGTHEDVCGALTGGIVAIGYLLGRTEPGQDNQEVKDLAAEFRRRFLEALGSTHCQTILDRLGSEIEARECPEVTATAAGLLADLLAERGISG